MHQSPYLVAVMGLPGTGKTFFAQRLASHLSAVHLSSDQVRHKQDLLGKYTTQDKLKVYRQLLTETNYWLQRKRPVVVDATFHRQVFRNLLEEVAHSQKVVLFYLRIVADENTIRERVDRKRPDSQADFSVYQQLKLELEPLAQPFLELNSSRKSLETMIDQATEYIHRGLSTV
ncbi:MAG: AAA family ATPase [Cyclobacteriaceae bacterium]